MIYGSPTGQSTVVTLLLIGVLVIVRILRSRGARPVNPLILVIMTLLIMYATYQLVAYSGALTAASTVTGTRPAGAIQPHVDPGAIPYYAIGALLGLALGVVRGRTINIFWDGATGQVMQRGGALSLLIWVALFAIRFGIQFLVSQHLVGSLATPISDAILLIGTGSIIGRNAYLLWRYVQLSGGMSTLRSS